MLVGGSICGAFLVFGVLSVLLYKPWRRQVDRRRAHLVPAEASERTGDSGLVSEEAFEDVDPPSPTDSGPVEIMALEMGSKK
jgi:nickel/cobalt transporter (NiCoT) family protein